MNDSDNELSEATKTSFESAIERILASDDTALTQMVEQASDGSLTAQEGPIVDEPSPVRVRGLWEARFLAGLRERGVITHACKVGNVSRNTAIALRDRCPEFKREWDEALEAALDEIEARGHEMASTGLTKAIYHMGQVVGYEQEVDAGMVKFFLERRRKEKFGEKIDINVTGQMTHVAVSPEDVARLLAARYGHLMPPEMKRLGDSQSQTGE
jgi:hypothetical protein